MSTYQPGSQIPITSRAHLSDAFDPQAPEEGRVGVEWELLPMDDGGGMVSYFGPAGVEAALSRFSPPHGLLLEDGHIAALKLQGGGMVGLEPGGQVELASPPFGRLARIRTFLENNLRGMEAAARPCGFRLKAWGVAPQNGEEDLPDVPKARYGILRDHLLRAGRLGRRMMKLTASTQVCLDYRDEAEMGEMVAAVLPVLPHIAASLANGPIFRGRRTSWSSQRPRIWRGTDARRCGLPAFLFKPRPTYADAARWSLGRPLLFLVREGRFVPGDGRSFDDWLRAPGAFGPMTMDDWTLHLSTLFPEVRLRGYLEVRTLDSVPLPLVMAAAALLKGLLSEEGRRIMAKAPLPLPHRATLGRALLEAGRHGPRWNPEAGPSVKEAMAALFRAGSAGLRGLGEDPGEVEPLRRLVRDGLCPADFWKQVSAGDWVGPDPLGMGESPF